MQLQTTRAGRFRFTPLMVLLLATAMLLATAVLTTTGVVDLPYTSDSETVTSTVSRNAQDAAHRHIERKFQLPTIDLGPQAQTLEQMRFLEQNLYLPDSVTPGPLPGVGVADQPVRSVDRMIFLEQNVWDYAALPKIAPPILYPVDQIE